MSALRVAASLVCWSLLASATGLARGQSPACGTLDNHYGPYDFRFDRARLPIVDKHHFTADHEALIRVAGDAPLGSHFDYTLRAFPNHHRALAALTQLALRTRSGPPESLRYPVDCYFERALRFRPDDQVVRMLWAEHLRRTQRAQQALDVVNEMLPMVTDERPWTLHNLGLLYFELGRYEQALALAHRGQALGVTRTDLADKLRAKGQWREPTEPASAPQTPVRPASAP